MYKRQVVEEARATEGDTCRGSVAHDHDAFVLLVIEDILAEGPHGEVVEAVAVPVARGEGKAEVVSEIDDAAERRLIQPLVISEDQ